MAALDIIESKLFKVPVSKTKRKPPSNMCKIHFVNKGIEMVNLPRILNNKTVTSAIPNTKFETPTVVYNLDQPIESKIFNFNNFVNTLDLNAFVNDNTILPCNCANSPFIDNHHKHILTGNLNIIENSKLRKLFSKGPKYREKKTILWEKTRESIKNGINECIGKWCDKYGVPAAIAIGAAGYDSYQKLRGKKGILPDLSGVVKGVYDKARGVFLSKQTQTDDEKQRQRRKVIDDIINNPDRLRNVNRKKKNISTNTEKPSKEDIERLKEIPKKKKINQDQDQQQSKPPEFDPKKQPETNNKTLKNLVKIGGAGAGVTGVAGIVNKLRKDQSQKQDKKIPTITKTKTKTGKSGKLPSIKFPGTAHIVGRRSNPQ